MRMWAQVHLVDLADPSRDRDMRRMGQNPELPNVAGTIRHVPAPYHAGRFFPREFVATPGVRKWPTAAQIKVRFNVRSWGRKLPRLCPKDAQIDAIVICGQKLSARSQHFRRAFLPV